MGNGPFGSTTTGKGDRWHVECSCGVSWQVKKPRLGSIAEIPGHDCIANHFDKCPSKGKVKEPD